MSLTVIFITGFIIREIYFLVKNPAGKAEYQQKREKNRFEEVKGSFPIFQSLINSGK